MGSLYDEPALVAGIMQTWRDDGVPPNVPMLITESNISSADSENSVSIFGALWLADYVGSFFTAGGDGLYYFHYIPMGVRPGCNNSGGSFGFFNVDLKSGQITQPLSQFFASQLINLEWLKPGSEEHKLFAATSDIQDDAGHILVTSYAVQRPDGDWALLIINKDQENSHSVLLRFWTTDSKTESSFTGAVQSVIFGREQYVWQPLKKIADPDGPAVRSELHVKPATLFELPAASITVLRGKLGKTAESTR